MDQKQIEEALKELDLSDVAFKLSQMALKLVSGKEIKEKTYSVPLSIPEELIDVFQMLADKVGVTVEEMLAHVAKEGFNASLKYRIAEEQQKMAPKPQPQQQMPMDQFQQMAKAVGFDMSGLQEKMGEFASVVNKLNSIQKVVENVEIPKDNIRETTKNSSEPAISLRTIPCPGDREE